MSTPSLDLELNDLRARCLAGDSTLTLEDYKKIIIARRSTRALAALAEEKPKRKGSTPKVSGAEALKTLDDLLGL